MDVLELENLPEAHKLALGLLKQTDGIPEGYDEKELLRFLRATKFRVDGSHGAGARLKKTIAWRQTSLPIGSAIDLPALPQILEALETKKWFSLIPLPNKDKRTIFYCPVKNLELGQRAAPWRSTPPRCYGAPRLLEQMCGFFYVWEQALLNLAPDMPEDLIILLNIKGVKRPPIAFIQRCTLFLGQHYPGRVLKVVIYPAPARIEHRIRGMLKFVDVGKLTEAVPLHCVNSREVLIRELSIEHLNAPGCLSWDDLPNELKNTNPLPCHNTRPPSPPEIVSVPKGGHFLKTKTEGPYTITPWYTEGVDASQISLEEELADFAAFVLPVPQELARRLALRSGVQEAVDLLCTGATVKLVGPDAYGLTVGGDALQLAVDMDDSSLAAKILEKAGHTLVTVAAGHQKVVGLSPCKTQIELLLGGLGAAARKCVYVVKQWLAEFAPGAATAYTVLRCVLRPRYTDESLGGLSSDALMMMVIHVCRRIRNSQFVPSNKKKKKAMKDMSDAFRANRTMNGERAVRCFLRYYGSEFDFVNFAVDPSTHEPLSKLQPSNAPAVLSPVPGWNLAENCTRVTLIQQQLLYCMTALAKADAKAATSAAPPHHRTSHRTALSSILCHDPFWKRREERRDPEGPIPIPGKEIVDKMQGTWRDMRGLVWEVKGAKVRCGNMTEYAYTMAAPAWTDGVYMLGANTTGPEGNCVTWDDGDVWWRQYDKDEATNSLFQ